MFIFIYFLMIILTVFNSFMFNNWLILWMNLELNMLTFLPLMFNKFNIKMKNNLMMKYFFIQSFSSMLFIFYNLMSMINMNNNIMMIMINNLMIMFSMLIKLGMFPFYYWYIQLMMNLKWMMCFILSTFQKIIPLMIMMNISKPLKILLMINFMNIFISTIEGMNQFMMKSLMAFSSINHLSWLLLLIFLNNLLFLKYLMIYIIINLKIMLFFKLNNLKFISEIYLNKFKLNKILLMLNMINLGGLPPLMGFILKWFTNMIMSMNYLMIMNLMWLMILSTITLFYYFYLILPSFLYFNINNKYFNYNNKFKLKFIMFMMYFFLMSLMFNNIF